MTKIIINSDFSPYLAVDLNKMADAFNCTVPELKKELVSLISSYKIQARIDSHSKVLYFPVN